jgi:tRNA nucleotidyltransferase (CCA-adding enzyme)
MIGRGSQRPLPGKVDGLLRQVAAWAAEQDHVRALFLVGSYARGDARDDSDVDLILLVDDPDSLLQRKAWPATFGPVERARTEVWGKVTSLRVRYADGPQVEFAIASLDWVRLPLDEGARRVLRDGFRSLYDPEHLLPAFPHRSAVGFD